MRILGRHGESKAEECEGTKRTLELVGIEGFDSSKPGNQMNQLNLKLKERKICEVRVYRRCWMPCQKSLTNRLGFFSWHPCRLPRESYPCGGKWIIGLVFSTGLLREKQ